MFSKNASTDVRREGEGPLARAKARLPSPIACLVFVVSVALLVAMGAFFGDHSGGKYPPGATQHITRADWQVQRANGFMAPPLIFSGQQLPDAWQPVELPLALPIALLDQADANTISDPGKETRTTWLRLKVPPHPGLRGPLALYGSRVKTDGTIAIYADGRLVYRAQELGPLWNSTRTPLWVVFEQRDDGSAARPAEILIRLEHTRAAQVGIASLWLGPVDALKGRYQMRQWLQQELPAMLSAAFMAVGVFALFVWLWRRHETGYLLFFNLATTSYLRGLHFYVSLPIANDWFAWLTVNALFWLVAVVHYALRQLHERPLTLLTWAVTTITLLVSVLTLPGIALLPNTPQVTPLIYLVVAGMATVVGLVGGISAWRRSPEGRLVAAGIGVCVLLGATDWMVQNNIVSPEGWYLGAYTNAVTFAVFGILLYRRYVHAIGEVERVNASLAQRLQARESELDLSHRRLREVERQKTISDERQRLMQDMHDGLGSSLISAIRSVEEGRLSDQKVSQILQGCLDDLKLTIDSMEPIDADLLLLLATLRYRLGPRLEGMGVSLTWEVQEIPPLPWLDPSSALHVLRIVQESISNTLRHTRATTIRVATGTDAAHVWVRIEDNGQGFDVEQALTGGRGRGLQNMQRRALAVQGHVAWESDAAGTRFLLWLPLVRAERPSGA